MLIELDFIFKVRLRLYYHRDTALSFIYLRRSFELRCFASIYLHYALLSAGSMGVRQCRHFSSFERWLRHDAAAEPPMRLSTIKSRRYTTRRWMRRVRPWVTSHRSYARAEADFGDCQ